MSHAVETLMYAANEKPWHGLGVAVQGRQTAAGAIKAAGLNWTVEKRAVYAESLGDTGVLIPGYRAIVRTTDNLALGVVGERYEPFQNSDAFDFFDSVVGEHAAMYETAGSLNEGRRIFLLAKLPSHIKVTRTDVVEKYLLLSNTHDGTGAIRMDWSPVRVVCQNTLNAALKGFGRDSVSIRHTKNVAQKVADAQKALGLANKYYDALGEAFKGLAKTKYTQKHALALVNHLFPSVEGEEIATRTKNNRERVLDLFETGMGQKEVAGTAWAAYNAVTEYADHHRSTRTSDKATEQESRLTANWWGSGRALKQNAWEYIGDQVGLKLGVAAA